MEGISETLSKKGGATVTVTHLDHDGESIPLAIKREQPQNALRSYWMAVTATHARRAFFAADRLFHEQHLCPEPFGYIERLRRGKVLESAFISRYLAKLDNFRDALIRLYKQQSDIGMILPLLKTVAQAMRRFHDTGLVHNDMGNQNILLLQTGNHVWESVRFVDLDHTRVRRQVSLRCRAYDVSRINLPDGLLTLFKQFYFTGRVPRRFEQWEKFYRRRFEWHRRTRILRHPLRTVNRRRHADRAIQIPLYRNIWFFDPRSAQSVDVFGERPPKPPRTLRHNLRQFPPALAMLPPVTRFYKRFRAECYHKRIDLNGRLGLSLELDRRNADDQLANLNRLPPIPVHMNLYRHQNGAELKFKLALIGTLHRRQSVVATLVQDRRGVRESGLWEAFCKATLPVITSLVDGVQIGRAVNRGHWGIWSSEEYHRLLDTAIKAVDTPDRLPLMGPGVENGRITDLLSSLAAIPEHIVFSVLAQTVVLGGGNGDQDMGIQSRLLSRMAWFKAFAGTVRSCKGKTALTQFGLNAHWTGYYRQINAYNGGLKPDSTGGGITAVGKLMGSVTEMLCSGMADQVYLHLPLHPTHRERSASTVFTQLTPQVAAVLNHWLTVFGGGRFVSRMVTEEGIHCLNMVQNSKEKVTLAYSPGGPRKLNIDFDCDKITDYQGNAMYPAADQIEIAQTPLYFHNVNFKFDHNCHKT